MTQIKITDISNLSRAEFVACFGGIYEHSAWIAETVYDQNKHLNAKFANQLASVMREIVDGAPTEAHLKLLRIHPELAGKLAATNSLTNESKAEQASAGLNNCTSEELGQFVDLNKRYMEKFGFPYILAVRGRTKTEILQNFQARLEHNKEIEFNEALNQVHQIAKLRLDALSI